MSFMTYLAGTAGLLLGLFFAAVPAVLAARRLLPGWTGPVAWTAVLVLTTALLILSGLLLGTFGILHGWTHLLLLALIAGCAWGWRARLTPPGEGAPLVHVPAPKLLCWAGFAIAAVAFGAFSIAVRVKLGTGMTGFDSTWYHGPFAAGFAQSGDTFSLHFLAPQFLSWFYPQNSELIHSFGVLAYGNDLLSPLINVFWFAGCLLAAWCIGRPYGGAPISLAGVALVLASAAMADQAGEARNDIVGTFFVLAALAVLINAAAGGRRITIGPAVVIGLAAGLAAGTKVNFIPAAIAIAIGAIVLMRPELRRRGGLVVAGAVILGGAYWYLRNLIHSGNPLPWINHVGPLGLPGPDQDVGGRDAGSVWGYLTDLDVIKDWFLPGFADGFGDGWIVLLALSVLAFVYCLGRESGPARRTGAAVGVALTIAWLVAPTSASGPLGEPNGFVSGLRYLAPALAVSMALLGSAVGARGVGARWVTMGAIALLTPFTVAIGSSWSLRQILGGVLVAGAVFLLLFSGRALHRSGWSKPKLAGVAGLLLITVLAGQFVQRSYLENRYANPDFTTAGLGQVFKWAQGIEGEQIATNVTRQYPLFGRDLDNEVQFVGVPGKHAGFTKPESCEAFRAAVADGEYRYLVVALDRPSPKRAFPREAAWIAEDPAATQILRREPAVVYRLDGKPDPALCG
ncbi:MAG TPA: hypothetical protein VMF31_01845 [Solirubrobacterales bacterium]|nr:hypothetical protein [Solirubrobacterales bacterium]